MVTGPTTLLIDGDPIVYNAAFAGEEAFSFGDMVCKTVDVKRAKRRAVDFVEWVQGLLKADSIMVCLSDPEKNWRHSVLPSYKGNRKAEDRPKLWQAMRDFLTDRYGSIIKPSLEADDIMGIYSTHPALVHGKKIIVSVDKDMKTIPGWLFNPDKDKDARLVGTVEAERFHLYQTLVGDAVDNYKGCPGVGPVAAEGLLDNPYVLEPVTYTFSRGPRKGLTETRYEKVEVPKDRVWEAVVSQYAAVGLTEQSALTQARVARICRACDYNFRTKSPILWNP